MYNNKPEGFVKIKRSSIEVLVKEDLADLIDEIGVFDSPHPDRWRSANGLLKGGRAGAVRVQVRGELNMIVKPLLRGGMMGLINKQYHFTMARIFNEAHLSNYMIKRGAPITPMLMGRSEGKIPFIHKMHLGFAEIKNARSLFQILNENNLPDNKIVDLFFVAGRAVRTLHDIRVFHHDLNLGNLLTADTNGSREELEVKVIDLDRSTFGRDLSLSARARNLARLLRHAIKNSFHKKLDLELIWRSFLDGYCGDGISAAGIKSIVERLYKRSIFFHRFSWWLHRK